jgi:hypothetical protein
MKLNIEVIQLQRREKSGKDTATPGKHLFTKQNLTHEISRHINKDIKESIKIKNEEEKPIFKILKRIMGRYSTQRDEM